MADNSDKANTSRRHFIQQAGALALAASPLRLFAAPDTSEGIRPKTLSQISRQT